MHAILRMLTLFYLLTRTVKTKFDPEPVADRRRRGVELSCPVDSAETSKINISQKDASQTRNATFDTLRAKI